MRLGLVGTGFIAALHARAAAGVSDVELVAACGTDPARAADFCTRHRADHPALEARPDLEALLSDVDAVIVATPTDTHEELVGHCLAKGVHVLVEKPMALEPAACDRMAAARPADRVLMVGQVLRHWPAYQTIRDLAAGRRFGSLRGLTLNRRAAAPPRDSWFADARRSGGPVTDLLMHDFDLALALLGEPQVVQAAGRRGDTGGFDQAYVTISTADATAALECFAVHAPGYPFTAECRAVFDHGVAELRMRAGGEQVDSIGGAELYLYPQAGGAERVATSNDDPYGVQLAAFVDACRRGTQPVNGTPEQARAAVALASHVRELLEAQS